MQQIFKKYGLASLLIASVLAGCSSPEAANVPLPTNATTQNPTAAAYNVQLGVAYLQQGDITRGKSKLLLAKQQDPTSPDVWDAWAFYNQRTGNTQEADQYYLKAISLNPKRGSSLNNYGAFLCQEHRYQESVKYFVAATQDQAYVNTAEAFENAGLCALQIPDSRQAQTYFTKALENNPNLATSTLELAQINFNNGKFDLANKYLERYNYLGKPTAESLWLSARLAQHANNQTQMAADLQQLQEKFPASDEYKQAKLSGLIT